MKFERTQAYIYENCVCRVKSKLERINEEKRKNNQSKVSMYSICPDDKPLVSHFFNNIITKNNRYLITRKLIMGGKDESGTGIINVLKFNSTFEVLWGTNEEFDERIEEILKKILLDIRFSDVKNSELDIIELVLCAQIPYAMYSTFYHIKEKYNLSSTIEYFGIFDDKVTCEYVEICMDNSIAYLLNQKRCTHINGKKRVYTFREEFKRIFENFARGCEDYKYFSSRLEKKFIPELISLFVKYKPEQTSLGYRVKWLIENEIVYAVELLDNQELAYSIEHRVKKDIVREASSYIVKLEELAEKYLYEGIHL